MPWTLLVQHGETDRHATLPAWPDVRTRVLLLLDKFMAHDPVHLKGLRERVETCEAERCGFLCIGAENWRIAAQVELESR